MSELWNSLPCILSVPSISICRLSLTFDMYSPHRQVPPVTNPPRMNITVNAWSCAKIDRSTSDCGDACWALECPTVGDTYTGLWAHHFYLSHKCSHFCCAFLRILIRGPSLIFLGTWKRRGRSFWDAELTLVPETSWINAASYVFLTIQLFDSLD